MLRQRFRRSGPAISATCGDDCARQRLIGLSAQIRGELCIGRRADPCHRRFGICSFAVIKPKREQDFVAAQRVPRRFV